MSAPPREAPALKGGFLFGNLREWRRDPLALLCRAAAAGEVVSFRLGPRRAHLVCAPEGIERVLVENHRNSSKRMPGQDVETTANALNWTFVLLSRHPEIDARLRRETAAALNGRAPSLDDLPNLPYALAVLKESMRLYPPAWIMVRRAESDDVVCGTFVPKGSLVMLSPYATQRDSRRWKNPETFDPERFLNGSADALHRYAYFPFGGGPRQCIGNAFALMEAHLVIAAVSQSCRLELIEPGAPEADPTVTLRPRRAVMVRARAAGPS